VKREVGREQYFTTRELARRCVDFTASLVDWNSFEHYLEPSAGEGSFLELLPQARRTGLDVEPRAAEVTKADFLGWEPPPLRGRMLTIGNPPFGQRAALAFSFLHRACAFSDVVGFILPRSFNKYTFQNRVPGTFHLLGSFDCQDFYGRARQPQSVNAVFQVWERRDELRARVDPPGTHPDFDMRHCHLSRAKPTDLVALRAGYAFGVAQVGSDFKPKAVASVTTGSHWFIRPRVPQVRARFERLDFAFLDGMNTAHKSLSKRDIVTAYEAVVEADRLTVAVPPLTPA